MRTLLVLSATLLLAACNLEAEEPKTVAQRYWQAMVDKDYETARSLVSSDSQQGFDIHREAVNSPEALQQVALDDQRVTVVTTINPDPRKAWRDRPFETVMKYEQGAWKIDLQKTRLPVPTSELERKMEDMANDMDGAVEDNLRTMEEVLEEGMKLFDESVEQGSKEMSNSFSRAMKKMQETMRESIEKMKQRREEMQRDDMHPQQSDEPVSGEGVI